MRFCTLTLLALIPAFSAATMSAADVREFSLQYRRPSAAVLINNGRSLCVANSRSGTVSLIATADWSVSEQTVGQRLSDLIRIPNTDSLIATDFSGHQLIAFRVDHNQLVITDRHDVAQWPVSISVSADSRRWAVASLWSRRLTLGILGQSNDEVTAGKSSTIIDLPFAPRAITFVDNTTLAVADAFGGRIAVVDVESAKVLSVRELPVHNIRNLKVDSGKRLFLTSQALNSKAHTEAEHIHWGVLIQNELRAIKIARLLDPQAKLAVSSNEVPLGEAGNGAGDPDAVAITEDRLFVTLAGTNELALIDRVGVREIRIDTGARPIDVILDEEHRIAFIVNQLSDSVTVVDTAENAVVNEISLGPTPEAGAVQRGEKAFFNARLSMEGWMSCHSCHTDGHTNNRLADTLGDGSFGNAKRVPTLRGVWSTGPWAWNGQKPTLHAQIRSSLKTTMHSPSRDNERLINDLVAYVTTLERPPSVSVARNESLDADMYDRSSTLFESAGCIECHHPFTSLTTDGVFDVGLKDSTGWASFNPPSLGSVSQRDRLLHDGRARSIEDVLIRFQHPAGNTLSNRQRRDLVTFLGGL